MRETQQACRNDGKCQIRTTNTVNTPITRALIYGHASSSPSLLDTSMRGLHHEPVLLAIVGHEDDIAVGGPDEAGQLQVVLGTWGSWLHWWNLVGLNAAELGGRVQHPDAAQQTGVHLRRTRIHQAPESICNIWPKRAEPQDSEPLKPVHQSLNQLQPTPPHSGSFSFALSQFLKGIIDYLFSLAKSPVLNYIVYILVTFLLICEETLV